MATKKKTSTVKDHRLPQTSRRYVKSKVILVVIIAVLALILVIDSKTGFIKKLVGDKTIELRIRK